MQSTTLLLRLGNVPKAFGGLLGWDGDGPFGAKLRIRIWAAVQRLDGRVTAKAETEQNVAALRRKEGNSVRPRKGIGLGVRGLRQLRLD